MMKKLGLIFVLAFALNYAWEHAHSFLYASYQGGSITEFILLRATLADALMITLITLPFLLSAQLAKRSWLIAVIGVAVAIGIEEHALATGRWAYNALMPLIPVLHIGLTPTIQLGLIGFLSFRIVSKLNDS